MMQSSKTRTVALRTALGGVAILALSLAGGCSSSSSSTSLGAFTSNPTPDMRSLYKTSDDYKILDTIVVDTNLRMLREDWSRLWLYERPTRLNRINTSY